MEAMSCCASSNEAGKKKLESGRDLRGLVLMALTEDEEGPSPPTLPSDTIESILSLEEDEAARVLPGRRPRFPLPIRICVFDSN